MFIVSEPAVQASREIYLTFLEPLTTQQGPLVANNIYFMQLVVSNTFKHVSIDGCFPASEF